MLGVRSKIYVSELESDYGHDYPETSSITRKYEYEFNDRQMPVGIKEFQWDGVQYRPLGVMLIEYNDLQITLSRCGCGIQALDQPFQTQLPLGNYRLESL